MANAKKQNKPKSQNQLFDKIKIWYSNENNRKHANLLAVPAVIIVLILAITMCDNRGKGVEEPSAEETVEESAAQDKFPVYQLKKNSDPVLADLMDTYFKARLESDLDTIDKIFNRTTPEDAKEAKTEALKQEVELIEGFENIQCYTKEGLEQGAVLAYVTYDIKFGGTKTLAPGLKWYYLKEDENQNYYIVEELNEEESDYIGFAEQDEAVQKLAEEQNGKLIEALSTDRKLSNIFKLLKEGAAGKENQADSETESQDSGESES